MEENYLLKNKNLEVFFRLPSLNTEATHREVKPPLSELLQPVTNQNEMASAIMETLFIKKGGVESEIKVDKDGFVIETSPFPQEQKLTIKEYADKEKRRFYQDLLKNKYAEIENVIVLSGAGSSVGIGTAKKGLTMHGLWDKLSETHNSSLKTLIIKTGYAELDDAGYIVDASLKDLEALLSKAGMKTFVETNSELEDAIKEIKKFIVEECTLIFNTDAPHSEFLHKVALRPQKFPRVKVFTMNYDTLFEQAATKERFTVIDGFTFSNPRVFNGKFFDYDIIETRHNRQDKKDSTIAKLFYLFKMHGSLTWKKEAKEIEQCDGDIDLEKRVMIFPQSNKYEHSYEQPYFEMMARFQQALRTENTLLITIGFSFLDKHISSVIIESLKQNPSLNLMVVTYPTIVGDKMEYQEELHRITEIQSRVTLIAETFKDFTAEFPENIAHKRFDLIESLSEQLKAINS